MTKLFRIVEENLHISWKTSEFQSNFQENVNFDNLKSR